MVLVAFLVDFVWLVCKCIPSTLCVSGKLIKQIFVKNKANLRRRAENGIILTSVTI